MKKPKVPTYKKVLDGMYQCFGKNPDDRDCSECPYDKYNDPIFGDGYLCMEKLNKDLKKFYGNMEFFSYCKDCTFYTPDSPDSDGGECRANDWSVMENDYCSRANRKDLM